MVNWIDQLSGNPGTPNSVDYIAQLGAGNTNSAQKWGAQQSPIGAGITNPATMGGPQSAGLWGKMGGMEGLSQGASAFASLAGIYSGFKSLGLAKDQFKFQKDAWQDNYNARAKTIQTNLKSKWSASNAAANARGQTFQDMDSWVADREVATPTAGSKRKDK